MLVDQEDNIPDQSRSFEGDDDLILGKEFQDVKLVTAIYIS